MGERKEYILLDICKKSFKDKETGNIIPYCEIWVKDLLMNEVFKMKPFDTALFLSKFDEYSLLLYKKVSLVVGSKAQGGKVYATVEDIVPIA